jgi:carbon starvation protein CstA
LPDDQGLYVAQALGGGFWATMMALAIALSVIAATGTGTVLVARFVLQSPFFSIQRESQTEVPPSR